MTKKKFETGCLQVSKKELIARGLSRKRIGDAAGALFHAYVVPYCQYENIYTVLMETDSDSAISSVSLKHF